MRKLILILLSSLPFAVNAQLNGIVTYEEAVALALQHNYDIRISKNNAEISAVENNLGYAGFLPRVDINSSGNFANNNTHQEFSSGQTVNQSGVVSKNITAGAYLSYTIFDGFKMFATKERLEILEQQGELGLKMQIENTLELVTLLYYQIVKQEQLIKGIQATMAVSEERIKVAQTKLKIGSGSNVELLQAKLDLNALKSNLLLQKSILKEYKNNLTLQIQAEASANFSVDTNFALENIEAIDEIRTKIENNNPGLLFAKKNILVTEQVIKEIKSQTLPRLGVTSSYVFGRTQNAAGFALFNQNLGYNIGFTFSWNIFNGFITKKQVQVANIQLQNSILNADRTKSSLFSQANIAYARWLGDKETLDLEEENIKLAEQGLYIMLERMKLGLGNYLETKESESSYAAAITRLVTARYNLKESETKLKKVTGGLVK